jgi:hypothetical protein
MRILRAASIAAATLTLGMSLTAAALADTADPSVRDIYQAAESGHLDQAQSMMDRVLHDHPTSAKAHYVQAELYAKEGKTALARSELGQAEQLDPGLTHETARSVQELKSQLGLSSRGVESSHVGMGGAPASSHFPWGMALVFVLAICALWLLFRRRNTYAQYPSGGAPALSGGPGTYGGPAGYGAGPVAGGGVGSSIAGGLASGLAVGAGVVAGEELAHHFLDGGAREGAVPQNREKDDWNQSSNSDMGGSDFGVNDPGSWGDSGGGGGGGDDWS